MYVCTYSIYVFSHISSHFRSYLRAVNSGASPQRRRTRSRSKPSFHLLPVTLCALPTHPRTHARAVCQKSTGEGAL